MINSWFKNFLSTLVILILAIFMSADLPMLTEDFSQDGWAFTIEDDEGCTVGAAMGNATTDSRPFSWKNRDGSGRHFIWFENTSGTYDFLAMGTSDGLKMGLNEAGLSLQNSLCEDMASSGYTYDNNTAFKLYALSEFGSVEEARQAIIEDTSGVSDHWPPPAICVNFSDALGFASTFELGGEIYYEYDPTNPNRLAQFPKQFVVRANDSHKNTDHTDDEDTGGNRYVVARDDMQAIADTDGLNVSNWINQVSRHGEPGIDDEEMPSRIDTRGVMLVHGVNEGEDPQIVTAWVALGNPDYTGFLPVWAAQQANISPWVATSDSTNSIAGLSNRLLAKRDDQQYDQYINSLIRPLEDNIIEAVGLARLRWFSSEFFLEEATRIHIEAADSLWHTMYSMSLGDGRNLNIPPDLTAINVVPEGLQVTFETVSSDDDGSIISYDWDFGDGTGSSSEAPIHAYSSGGVYLVRCRVIDNDGAQNSKWRYLNVVGDNLPPSVDAGEDLSVNVWEYTVLAGQVIDDGLPNPPAAIITTWEKISGPGVVTFGDSSLANTTVNFSEPGFYLLRLSAYDGQLISVDEVGITVNPENTAPSVSISAPTDGAAFDEGTPVTFTGTATDTEDGDLSANLNWSSDLDGTIGTGGSFSYSGLSVGTHTITAAVTDSGGLSGSDQITITANYAQNEYTLTTISDHGTVTKNPDQISYHLNDVVQLTATADVDWSFIDWSGDVAGIDNPINVTITGDMTITANYQSTKVILISPSGTLTSWDKYLRWSGTGSANYYWVDVRDAADAQLLFTYYNTTICAGLDCAVRPSALANLANGDYKWRMRTYTIGVGYSPWTEYTNFTLDIPTLTLVSPSGTMTSWDKYLRWTGIASANYYWVDVRDAADAQLLYTYYNTTVCAGLDCAVRPSALVNLANGDYKWRMRTYTIGLGYGPWTEYTNFTLDIPILTLVSPSGTMTSWDKTLRWTGIASANFYWVDVRDAADTPLLYTYYNTSVCSGLDCMVRPSALANLPNGNYKWRMRTYTIGLGYGPWTEYTNFTLDIPTLTLVSPSGTMTSWDKTLRWTGIASADFYWVDVRDATDTQLLFTYYNTSVCSGLDCSVRPSALANLPNGNYKWRMRTYTIGLGYSPWTEYTNFTLDIPTLTLVSPAGTMTSWDKTLRWTGIASANFYWIDVRDAADARLLYTYYNTSVCSGLDCVVAPSALENLANGDYKWRMRTYTTGVGYGSWTEYTPFILNLP